MLRRRVLCSRRAARLRQGSCKKRILAAWRELQRLCRYGTEIPQALTDVALEARFSDHEMTEAQLEQMRAFLAHERKRLSESLPPLKRLAARTVLERSCSCCRRSHEAEGRGRAAKGRQGAPCRLGALAARRFGLPFGRVFAR